MLDPQHIHIDNMKVHNMMYIAFPQPLHHHPRTCHKQIRSVRARQSFHEKAVPSSALYMQVPVVYVSGRGHGRPKSVDCPGMNMVSYLRASAVRIVLSLAGITVVCFLLLDRPILRELYTVMVHLGDFSQNLGAEWRAVSQTVQTAYQRSMILLASSIAVSIMLGLGLGLVAGSRAGTLYSRLITGISYMGLVTPSFLLALAIMVFFVRYLTHWLDTQFILLRPTPELTLDPRYIIAPALTLAARPIAHITHITATALRAQLTQDYIRTARGKGLSRYRTLQAHAWPNIMVSVLTAVHGSLLFSLSSLPIVEFVFSWPGLGLHLLSAVLERDTVSALFLLLSIGLTFLVFSMVVELLSRWLDPRLRNKA